MVALSAAKRRPAVLVVGSLNMDLVLEVPRMPLPGESMPGRKCSRIPGGKGANQAVALARLGAAVTLSGQVGRDADGETLIHSLEQEGIATDFVFKTESCNTGLAVILLDDTAQNAIVSYPGANLELKEECIETVFRAGKFDGLMLQLEVADEIVVACCRLAMEAGIPVCLDAGPARNFPLEQIRGIALLTPNETEVRALTGREVKTVADAIEASAELMDRANAQAVVIKMGAAGALLRTRQGICEHFPAIEVRAVDPTAAGDAFTAAMMIRYLDTGDLRQAVQYAIYSGALATTRLGAQASLPSAAEIAELMERAPAKRGARA